MPPPPKRGQTFTRVVPNVTLSWSQRGDQRPDPLPKFLLNPLTDRLRAAVDPHSGFKWTRRVPFHRHSRLSTPRNNFAESRDVIRKAGCDWSGEYTSRFLETQTHVTGRPENQPISHRGAARGVAGGPSVRRSRAPEKMGFICAGNVDDFQSQANFKDNTKVHTKNN